MKRREVKSKGENVRYTHLNAEFQRIARRDKKPFLSDQCKEIEENNIMGKTRDLFMKIRDTRGTFHASSVQSVQSLSCVRLFTTPWTVAFQAPMSMGFSRQEHWSGLPCLPPGHLPNPGIEPRSPALQVDSLPSEPPGKP